MSSDPGNPLSWILPIVVTLVLVLFSGFFSLIETAYTCMNQFKVKVLADDGNKKAKQALKLYEKFDRTLISTLVGHNIVTILCGAISTVFFVFVFDIFGGSETVAGIISTVVITIFLYLFGDTIPKFIAKGIPDKIAVTFSYVSTAFIFIFYPLILVFAGLTKFCNFIFKNKERPTITEEEFTDIIEDSEENGLFEGNESDIIQATLDFDDTKVKKILTPRDEIFALNLNGLSNAKLLNILIKNDYSRIPIYKDNLDNIIGILHVRTFLKEFRNNKSIKIEEVLQKPYFVTPNDKLETIFDGFKSRGTHMAIVKKDGVVIGMVTMNDVLEELVGKIDEEVDEQ